jgi:hypothetical protein
MGSYANYLDVRIKAWKEIKHDLVQVQTESNRRSDGQGAGCESLLLTTSSLSLYVYLSDSCRGTFIRSTSQTYPIFNSVTDVHIAKARRLRNLPVDKGLLREVKQVQRILDSLVQCRVSFTVSSELKQCNTCGLS